jgi:hypothetical protein
MHRATATTDSVALPTMLRLVQPSEAEAVYEVHAIVRRSLPHASFMYGREPDFFRDIASRSGRLIGAYCGDQLVGYAALSMEQPSKASHWRYLQHLCIAADEIAEGAGGAVLPEYRRMGVHGQLLRERNRVASGLGLKFQTSIVAPANIASLRSFLRERFLIAARYQDGDGDNYLMLKPLVGRMTFDSEPGHQAALDDVAGNFRFLQSGLCGVPCEHGKALHIRYHAIAHSAEAPPGFRRGGFRAQ